MKRNWLLIASLLLMVVLSSCSRHYKYQVVHTNNRVEVISTTGDDLVIDDKLILVNKCHCDEYAYDVKSFRYISLDYDYNKKVDRNNKIIILIFISIVIFTLLFLIIFNYFQYYTRIKGKKQLVRTNEMANKVNDLPLVLTDKVVTPLNSRRIGANELNQVAMEGIKNLNNCKIGIETHQISKEAENNLKNVNAWRNN